MECFCYIGGIMRIRKISQEGISGFGESSQGPPITQAEMEIISQYVDKIVDMGQEGGSQVVINVVKQLSLQSHQYLLRVTEQLAQMPLDHFSKLRSHIGTILYLFNVENQKKITKPPEDYNFSKEFGILEPPVFVTEIERRKVIDETLDRYNKGEIPKEQMQSTLREFAFSKKNWYKEAQLAELMKKPVDFAQKMWESIGPKSLPTRENLIGKIKAFDMGKIVAAIKRWGQRDIGRFPISTDKEIDDVLFVLEDGDLAGVLENLQT